MAVKPSSPAINISEIDKTAVVPAVGSSGGGFVGNFRWGPVGQRTLIADETGLVSTFAAPDDTNSVDFHSAAYFLKYSQTLQVVRGCDDSAVNAHSALTEYTGNAQVGDSANDPNVTFVAELKAVVRVNNLSHWTNTVSSAAR